ncbi:hypothetical protein D3C71_216690 [compost metagenome]
MGGHISVGVRRADGSFRTIGVWTNPLGHFLRERAFRVDGSLEPLDRFLARYLKDEADFGGPQENTPGEYGYVLIDEMTKTITNMNSYSSFQWVNQSDMGYVSSGRMYATQEALDEMAEMREIAIRAKYAFSGSSEYTYEDLPPFTTHEAMFATMKELTQREPPVEERIDRAIAAIKDAVDAFSEGAEGGSTDFEIKLLRAEMAVNDISREEGDIFRHSLFVQYELDFPAWRIVDLWPHTQEDFVTMKAAVESCVVLTDDEQAAWKEDYDCRFGDDWPGLTGLVEENPANGEQGGN